MYIVRATAATQELIDAIERLIPQLNLTVPPPTRSEVEALISSDTSVMLVARFPNEQAPIAGILTLIVYRVPTGIRARIEDVVVDELMRGKGVGEALVRFALNMARNAGADGVENNETGCGPAYARSHPYFRYLFENCVNP